MSKFVGREKEMAALKQLTGKKTASFIIVRGRRRVGKSRLIEEFSKNFDKFYKFEGLAPDPEVTAATQLEEFSRQLAAQFKTAYALYDNWSNALWALGERVQKGKILIFFDEISWMGMDEPAFLGRVKYFWDNYLKKNDSLIFVVCGSASAWIQKNILSSKGFVGRISYTLNLRELPLLACNHFWGHNISAYEKFKVLSVTGGIPKYLEEVQSKYSAEENIKRLCFTEGAILVEEFKQIFSDLFLHDSVLYKKIIEVLVSGPKIRNEICEAIGIEPNGKFSDYMYELELAGFISRDHTWNIKSGVESKLSKYRLSDNYLRFYLKYIDKEINKINQGKFQLKSLTILPEWNSIMGLQFENLVINNCNLIHQALNITNEYIISENPFYQSKTYRQQGCQIDYLIQTQFTLYVCEIKFSKNKIDSSIIDCMKEKINRLVYPKGYSIRPVLIHVNGVTEELVESDYFSFIIDFSTYMSC